MKAISAIAIFSTIAMSVPAFAQPPAAHVVEDGAGGATTGAIIGCLATIPIGCAPGAAIGAAVGGGTGMVVGAATIPAPANRYYGPNGSHRPPPR